MPTGADACELRITEVKAEGVFATKPFKVGELVVEGDIERRLSENTPHASQVSKQKHFGKQLVAGFLSQFPNSWY